MPTVEDVKTGGVGQLKGLSNWDQIRVPGLQHSMSMSDLVSHLENRISEQGSSSNPALSSEDWQSLQILDDIKNCLFTDIQQPDSDEKLLMSRVDSLCCLLQKDTNVLSKSENSSELSLVQKDGDEFNNGGNKSEENYDESSMSRKDSVGDLLLNLPRIASLPQFLFNISEDYGRAR